MQKSLLNIISDGRRLWIKSTGYRNRAQEIRENIHLKYSVRLSEEKNIFKRLLLKGHRVLEIHRQISELRSHGNLHIFFTSKSPGP